MAIKLLVNTVYQATQVLNCTQNAAGSYADTTETEQRNVVGGPRHIKFTRDDANTRQINYIETNGGLSADTCVATNADAYNGQAIKIVSFETYKGGPISNVVNDASFTETCIGPYAQDYVWEFTQETSKQAFGFDVSSYATFGKVFFCNAFSFEHQPASGPLAQFRPVRATIQHGGRAWNVEQQGTFFFSDLTASEVNSFHALFGTHEQHEPVFLYDSDGTVIADKLWHCLIMRSDIQQTFDDVYQLTLETFLLRHYE